MGGSASRLGPCAFGRGGAAWSAAASIRAPTARPALGRGGGRGGRARRPRGCPGVPVGGGRSGAPLRWPHATRWGGGGLDAAGDSGAARPFGHGRAARDAGVTAGGATGRRWCSARRRRGKRGPGVPGAGAFRRPWGAAAPAVTLVPRRCLGWGRGRGGGGNTGGRERASNPLVPRRAARVSGRWRRSAWQATPALWAARGLTRVPSRVGIGGGRPLGREGGGRDDLRSLIVLNKKSYRVTTGLHGGSQNFQMSVKKLY